MRRHLAEKAWRASTLTLSRRVSSPILRKAGKLLDQQFWLWGRDVLRTTGNGLVQAGFQRMPVPDGRPGSSCYEWTDAHSRLRLWGFGLQYSHDENEIFLSRCELGPCLIPGPRSDAPGWLIDDIPRHVAPVSDEELGITLRLTSEVCRFIEEYEEAATRSLPEGTRETDLTLWKKRCTLGGNVAPEWHELRRVLELAEDAKSYAA